MNKIIFWFNTIKLPLISFIGISIIVSLIFLAEKYNTKTYLGNYKVIYKNYDIRIEGDTIYHVHLKSDKKILKLYNTDYKLYNFLKRDSVYRNLFIIQDLTCSKAILDTITIIDKHSDSSNYILHIHSKSKNTKYSILIDTNDYHNRFRYSNNHLLKQKFVSILKP